jgi:ribosomal protein S1
MQVGEQIKALVLNMDPQAGRLSLSTKKLEQQPGDLLNLSREEFCQQAEEQHGQAAKDAARAKFAASR